MDQKPPKNRRRIPTAERLEREAELSRRVKVRARKMRANGEEITFTMMQMWRDFEWIAVHSLFHERIGIPARWPPEYDPSDVIPFPERRRRMA